MRKATWIRTIGKQMKPFSSIHLVVTERQRMGNNEDRNKKRVTESVTSNIRREQIKNQKTLYDAFFPSKNKPTPLLSVTLNHSSTRPPSPHPFMTHSNSTDGGATNSNDACSIYREPFSSFSPPLRCQQRDQCLHLPSEAGLMTQMCRRTLACPDATARVQNRW